jgi:hypothetical protein
VIELMIFHSFLQKLKRIEKAHSTFITGLEFLPTSEETEAARGFTDASVVSISVDHQVCIHHIPRLRKNILNCFGLKSGVSNSYEGHILMRKGSADRKLKTLN